MSVRTTVKFIQDIMRQDSGVDGDAQRISQLCWVFFLKIIDDQDQEFEVTQVGYKSPIPRKLQWRSWAADPEGITGEALLAFINDELFPALKALAVAGQDSNRRRVVRDVFEDAYNYMKSGQLMRQVVNKINEIDFNDLAERQHFGDIYEQVLNDLQSAGNAGEYYTPRAVTAFMVDRIDPRPGEILFDPACGTGGFLTCALRHMRDRYIKRTADEDRMQTALRAVEKKQLPHMLCVTNMLLHGVEDPSFVRHDNTLARPYISYTQSDRVDIVLTNPPFGGREEDGIESNFPQHFRTRETADLFLALIVRLLKSGGRAAVVLPDGSLFGDGVKTRLKEHLLEECNLHTIVRLPNSVFKPYAGVGTNLLFFEKGEPTEQVWYYEHRVPPNQKAYSMTKPIRLEHLQGCIDWWGGLKRKGRQETELAWKVSIDEIKRRAYNLDIRNPHTVEDDHGHSQGWLSALNENDHSAGTLRKQLKSELADALVGINATELLTHLERAIDSADSVAKLRRFILSLGVRGKLVPQISSEGADFEFDREIPVSAERPFEIPPSWKWARLRTLGQFRGGGTPSKARDDFWQGSIPWVSPKDMKVDYLSEAELTISDSAIAGSATKIIETGSVLFVVRGMILAHSFPVAVTRVPLTINQDMKALVLRKPEMAEFLLRALKGMTPQMLRRVQRSSHGTCRLEGLDYSEFLLPVPPAAEQDRIVVRISQLMAICGQLEKRLLAGQEKRSGLLTALLSEALMSNLERDRAA